MSSRANDLDLKQSMAKIRKALGPVLDRIMKRYPPDGPFRACGVWACGWPSGDTFVKVTQDHQDAMAAQVIKDQGSQFRDVLVDVHEVLKLERGEQEASFFLIVTERVQPLDALDPLALVVDAVYDGYKATGPHGYIIEKKFDRLHEVERQLGINLVRDAHPGNWGLRDPFGDARARAESLVVFDFGLSDPPPVGLKKFKNAKAEKGIKQAILQTVKEWQKEFPGVKPEQINQGGCEDFMWSVKEKLVYLGDSLQMGAFSNEDEYAEVEEPDGHVWLEYAGRAYDAQNPEGVDDYLDLEFFKQWPAWVKAQKRRANPALTVKRGKVYADGVCLQAAIDAVRKKNLLLIGPFVPAFLFGDGLHIVYLARDEKGAHALREAATSDDPDAEPMPLFSDRAPIMGPGTLAMIWRNKLARKHLVAAVQFRVDAQKLVLTHKIVKESFRRNGINTLMIDFIREVFPGRELEFKDPTIDGSAFMKGYGK